MDDFPLVEYSSRTDSDYQQVIVTYIGRFPCLAELQVGGSSFKINHGTTALFIVNLDGYHESTETHKKRMAVGANIFVARKCSNFIIDGSTKIVGHVLTVKQKQWVQAGNRTRDLFQIRCSLKKNHTPRPLGHPMLRYFCAYILL